MEAMGLSNVRKDEILVTAGSLKKRSYIRDRAGEHLPGGPGAYQTDFVTEGEESFDLVFLGKGTARDYEGKDVRGKLVVVEINQRNEWWINFPVYQACEKGAKALIAVQTGGYGQIDKQALNAQDIAGPAEAPAFSMSQEDWEKIRESLDEKGEIRVGKLKRPFRCHEKCADLQYCRGDSGKTAGADDSALSPLRFLFQRFPG